MPVGTRGAIKALLPDQVLDLDVPLILTNAYHLHLRPGEKLIEAAGGLHAFMNWPRPILSDSGGFQIFSLAASRSLSDEGVCFRSHLDGDKVFLGPAESFRAQSCLGVDIAMVLDECPPWPCEQRVLEKAVMRTLKWAETFRDLARYWMEKGHLVLGIVQGSSCKTARANCARALVDMDFSGYAVGGVSVGEPPSELFAQVAMSLPYLPQDKLRYVMGVGTPPQLLRLINMGVDLFDCVLPTRLARHGVAFTPDGPIALKQQIYKEDLSALGENSPFSRAYARYLCVSGELSAHPLLSLHNLNFYTKLMREARAHIIQGDFSAWSQAYLERYENKRD